MDQETKTLYFSSNNSDVIKNIYAELQNNTRLPQMDTISISNQQYSGLYWRQGINSIIGTMYGRSFSDEELNGAHVALLATDYLQTLGSNALSSIWKTGITIDNIHFDAIGNYNSMPSGGSETNLARDNVPTTIAIPLKTYLDLGLDAERLRCVFAQSLTSSQRTVLDNIFKPYQSQLNYLSLPTAHESEAIHGYFDQTWPFFLVMILSLICIANILFYWLRKDFARFRAYLICGATGKKIGFLISFQTMVMVTLTYVCSFFIIRGVEYLVPGDLTSWLPWPFYVLIYLAVSVFSLVAINLKALPLIFHEKMLS